MLNFKKLMLAACGLALTLSATIVSASAATEVDIRGGSTYKSTMNSIVVSVSGLATSSSDATANFTTDGMPQIKITPKGAVKAVAKTELGANGLHYLDDFDDAVAPTWNIELNTSASEDYDILNVGWYGENPCFTSTGDIVEVRLAYNAGAVELNMEVLSGSVITTCDSAGGNVTADAPCAANTTAYTLAADSATVTKGSPTPSVVWETATPYGDYVGERTIAAAYTVELTGTGEEDTYDAVTWKVTVGDDSRGHVTEGLSLGGTGKFKLGLAVGGVTTSNATVQAALGDQTPSQQ